MSMLKKTGILLLLVMFCAALFAPSAQAAAAQSSEMEEQVFSYNSGVSADESEPAEKTNVWGIVAWVVIGLGIVFILYVLLSAPKRRSSMTPSGVKYRRSPYKKRKKRIMEEEYYKYKRDKYKF